MLFQSKETKTISGIENQADQSKEVLPLNPFAQIDQTAQESAIIRVNLEAKQDLEQIPIIIPNLVEGLQMYLKGCTVMGMIKMLADRAAVFVQGPLLNVILIILDPYQLMID